MFLAHDIVGVKQSEEQMEKIYHIREVMESSGAESTNSNAKDV